MFQAFFVILPFHLDNNGNQGHFFHHGRLDSSAVESFAGGGMIGALLYARFPSPSFKYCSYFVGLLFYRIKDPLDESLPICDLFEKGRGASTLPWKTQRTSRAEVPWKEASC